MQAQVALALGQGPLAGDGHVVPLPDRLEARRREIVAAFVWRRRRGGRARAGLHPGARRPAEVLRQAEVRPAIGPRHRRQRRQAADRVGVHHREAPPLPRRRVDDPALVNGVAARRLRVAGPHGKRRRRWAAGWPQLQAMALGEAEVLAAAHLLVDFPGPREAIGARGRHAHLVEEPRARQEVLPADLVEVEALAHARTWRDDLALRAGDDIEQIGGQLSEPDAAVAPHDVGLPVVVEEHRQIVERPLHRRACPRPGGVRGPEQLRRLAVDVAEDVERALVEAEARRPDALPVDALAFFEPERRAEIQRIERVGEEPPVHQIARVQDRQSGHAVHGRAGQVEILADADEVAVGELVVEQRVGERPVAVVRGPGRRLGPGPSPGLSPGRHCRDCQYEGGGDDAAGEPYVHGSPAY